MDIASVLNTAFIIIVVVLFFNLMIFVHELGHFWAARWRGLHVDRFQIWFGKPLWKKTINGVQWGLGWIPAGGFVSLPQMAPMEAIEGKADIPADVKAVTPLDKIIVAAAGPLFSFLLAFVFAVIVWGVGKPTVEHNVTTVGYVVPDSPGSKAGFLPGDKIIAIDGQTVTKWLGTDMDGVRELIMLSEGKEVSFTVQRPGVDAPLTIKSGYEIPETHWWQRHAMRRIGIGPADELIVDSVMENSPAAAAELAHGDRIVSANGVKLWSVATLMDILDQGKLVLEVQKADGTLRDVEVHPAMPDNWVGKKGSRPMLGILWGMGDVRMVIEHPKPWSQIKQSLSWMGVTMQKLFASGSDVGVEHLSGPVGIASNIYTMLTKPSGWMMALWFAVVLNVNLAVINMLPLPVVDGGHVVLNTLELIFRRPVGGKFLEYIQVGFVFVLMFFFLYVTSKDFGDLFGKSADDEAMKLPEPVFQAK